MNTWNRTYINFHPGEEAGEQYRAWQGCPTIARTRGGRLFAGWYSGGAFEPCIDNFNVLVKSDDDGLTWSEPLVTIGSDREARNRNIDIQLWMDPLDRLWVMWTHSPYYESSKPATILTPFAWDYHKEFTGVEAMVCDDPDADELTFSEPRVICFGFLRCQPLATHTGRWIFPAYDWTHAENYMLRVTDDEGRTFRDIAAAAKPANGAFDETMVWETSDNHRLRLQARTNLGYFAAADSTDDGETWGKTFPLEDGPSSRFCVKRLSDGHLAYIRNADDKVRTGMIIRLSDDDGATWSASLMLDTRENVSYPDLAEENGVLWIVHDRERDNRIKMNAETRHSDAAKEILLSRVTVREILNGRISEPDSYVARVISKGRMDTVEK